MESRRNGPQLSSRNDDDDDDTHGKRDVADRRRSTRENRAFGKLRVHQYLAKAQFLNDAFFIVYARFNDSAFTFYSKLITEKGYQIYGGYCS